MKYWASAPERVVVGIYAFALAFPLLEAIIARVPGVQVPYPHGTYAFFLPLSITLLAVLFSPSSLGPLPNWSSPPDWFIILGGVELVILILFYPLLSYFLWRRYRVAWVLSFISSLATISLEAYSASQVAGIIRFWAFGMAVNFVILYLLLRCRSKFFNPWS